MLSTYMITGWSARRGQWIPERIEAKSMAAAKERFIVRFPTLKHIKAYELRSK